MFSKLLDPEFAHNDADRIPVSSSLTISLKIICPSLETLIFDWLIPTLMSFNGVSFFQYLTLPVNLLKSSLVIVCVSKLLLKIKSWLLSLVNLILKISSFSFTISPLISKAKSPLFWPFLILMTPLGIVSSRKSFAWDELASSKIVSHLILISLRAIESNSTLNFTLVVSPLLPSEVDIFSELTLEL